MRRVLAVMLLALLAGIVRPEGAIAQRLDEYDYENLVFRGVGFDVGRTLPGKVESTHVFQLRVDLGYLGPAVRIVPAIGYWSSELQEEERARLVQQLNAFGADLTVDALGPIQWSDLYMNLDAHVVWTTPFRLLTFLGAGAGVHALNGQGQAIQNTFVEDLLDSMTLSGDLIAGVELPLADRFRIYGEARFTMMSDLHYGTIRFGGAVMLPQRQSTGSPASASIP